MPHPTIWDPLRKKEVSLTPEEKVRQWFIGILQHEMKVPVHMMMSEAPLNLGNKKFRADILVFDRKAKPLAIVECKRPEVRLDNSVVEQAIRYNIVLGVSYIILTNGHTTFIFKKGDDGKFAICREIPTYETMVKRD